MQGPKGCVLSGGRPVQFPWDHGTAQAAAAEDGDCRGGEKALADVGAGRIRGII